MRLFLLILGMPILIAVLAAMFIAWMAFSFAWSRDQEPSADDMETYREPEERCGSDLTLPQRRIEE